MKAGKGKAKFHGISDEIRHARNLDVYVSGWLLPARVTDLVGCL